MSFQITLDGDDLVRLRLDRLVSGIAGSQRRIVTGIAAEVETQTRRRIENEKTGPDGSRWPAWSPVTARYYSRHGGRNHLLHKSGHLLDSIRARAVADDTAIVAANRIYAAIHQSGGMAGKGHSVEIPARPYFGISRDNQTDIDAVVSSVIDEIIRGSGL